MIYNRAKKLVIILILISANIYCNYIDRCNKFFIKTEVGGSFAKRPHICVDNREWSRACEGYDAKLSNTELYNVGIGYRFNDLVSVDLQVSHRQKYRYRKFQTPIANVGFLGDSIRTRHFELSNTSITGNLCFFGAGISDCLAWCLCDGLILQPFIGAGAGVAYNKLQNFYTVLDNDANIVITDGLQLRRAASVELPITHRARAVQAVFGLELTHQYFAFGAGYRYFDAGRFKSNNYLVSRNSVTDPSHAGTAIPWVGKLRANEVFAYFDFLFPF